MRGRKPKPTAMKLAEGNPGKRPIGSNPQPPAKLPAPPKHLSKDGKKVWKALGPRFAALGIMAEVDEVAFAILCESYASYVSLVIKARDDGPIVRVNGQAVPNPYLVRADREAEKVRKLLAEFGGSPSSRARLNVGTSARTPAEADDIEGFLRIAQ